MFAVEDKHLWQFQDNKKRKNQESREQRWLAQVTINKMYNLLSLPKLVSARVIVDKVETFSRMDNHQVWST